MSTANSYDEVPYQGQAYLETHPDGLAALARLHGLLPPDVATARVLELGCADGGNLIPMAVALPDARFIGIDQSQRQIADGQALIARLGLRNIELQARSLVEIGPDFGTFDYVICHGVYSWVPPDVRAHCLEICRRNLAPNGVAFVSYNTYPGWHSLEAIRGMMLHKARSDADPKTRVDEVRQYLDQLLDALPDPNTPYAAMLRNEVPQIRAKSDAYILHEYLEADNQPLHFHEFASAARSHGLRVLTDARFHLSVTAQPEPLRRTLEKIAGPDPVRQEQAFDFLRNRAFRRSLLIPTEATPTAAHPDNLKGLRVSGLVTPIHPRPDLPFTHAVEDFIASDRGRSFKTAQPLMKAALAILADAWPRSIPVPELLAGAGARIGGQGNREAPADALTADLARGFAEGVLALHTWPAPFVMELSDQPYASAFARYQAESGPARVTNLRHQVIELSAFDRLVLRRLDGANNHAAIVDGLIAAALDGTFPLKRDGQALRDVIEIRQVLERSLGPSLLRIRESALLMDPPPAAARG